MVILQIPEITVQVYSVILGVILVVSMARVWRRLVQWFNGAQRLISLLRHVIYLMEADMDSRGVRHRKFGEADVPSADADGVDEIKE